MSYQSQLIKLPKLYSELNELQCSAPMSKLLALFILTSDSRLIKLSFRLFPLYFMAWKIHKIKSNLNMALSDVNIAFANAWSVNPIIIGIWGI